ncbi:TPA: hypothetical protein UL581_004927 [Klebsiella pneumoniae]|uniref:hypothetical protein n=1 Tax=Klebsiella pneumoniae complex TaxID=3390273 RepID=UPI00108277ED|nr:hypothetical protein [Klebsiella pneumoniae]VGB01210.1 Uncharacterised protein [Klebsiella pneumoniae]HDZ1199616.1 hypothetical protein [Klebsiella pneumoniae]HEE0939748.1 hypothetical protein [Klebsiella pneumoniae]HEL7931913.1 hypothetical protein [Klebsiella pneumoniae]
MNIETVNELIASLESAGELSIKETKVMALAKAFKQLAAENVTMLRLLTDISDNHVEYFSEGEDGMFAGVPLDYVSEINMYVSRDVNAENPFPATDRIVAGIKADAITASLDACSDYLETDCVMDRLDISYEEAEKRTSGAIELHDAMVNFANQVREGADK